MKNLFLILLASLIVFTQAVSSTQRRAPASGIPVLYWNTDPNPTRLDQIKAFQCFLERSGLPPFELRLDSQNQGISKILIQGVSGVAGDLLDIPSGYVPYLAEMGLLMPLGESWKRLGLTPEALSPAVWGDIRWNGEIWGHPMSTSMDACLVNVEAFRKVGMEPPPMRWDFEAFEKAGREYMRRANPDPARPRNFFISELKPALLRRTVGVSMWNETLTAPAMDTKAHVGVLERVMRWQDRDHLAPTEADVQSMSVDSGYGGAFYQLFHRGDIAILMGARHALIQLRQMKGRPEYRVSEPPHGGYPCTTVSTRSSVIYKAGKHTSRASAFHAFLRSPEYVGAMIDGGDAIPPILSALDTPAFHSPAAHTNEWALQRGLASMMREIGQGKEYSPYASYPSIARVEAQALAAMRSRVVSPALTARALQEGMEKAVAAYLKSHPEARARHAEKLAIQNELDLLKTQGRPLPLDKVDNPFLKRYLKETGTGR